MNRVMLLGRLGRDPEERVLPDGRSLCVLSVATNESWTDREGVRRRSTDWHRVVAGGRLAGACAAHLRRGRRVLVEGALRTRRWEDMEGRRHTLAEVQAVRVDFLDGPRSAETPGPAMPAGDGGEAARPGAEDAAAGVGTRGGGWGPRPRLSGCASGAKTSVLGYARSLALREKPPRENGERAGTGDAGGRREGRNPPPGEPGAP